MFFTDSDRIKYLNLLGEYCKKHDVDVLAYCLMSNHIHFVAVPNSDDALHRVLKPLHMRYAQHVNRKQGWKGHVWKGRFFSSPLDEEYLWAAIRYVERNPVRAKMVSRAEDYQWSSAMAHCGTGIDSVLSKKGEWVERIDAIPNWSSWLGAEDDDQKVEVLRMNSEKGLPCGSDEFVGRLGKMIGRVL